MVFIDGFQHFLYVPRPSLSGVSGFPFLSNIFSTVSIGTCASFVSIYLCTYLCIYLPTYLSICIYLYLSLSISIYLGHLLHSRVFIPLAQAKGKKPKGQQTKCKMRSEANAKSQKPKAKKPKNQKPKKTKPKTDFFSRKAVDPNRNSNNRPRFNRTEHEPNREKTEPKLIPLTEPVRQVTCLIAPDYYYY